MIIPVHRGKYLYRETDVSHPSLYFLVYEHLVVTIDHGNITDKGILHCITTDGARDI
jgi:hypothetical protein